MFLLNLFTSFQIDEVLEEGIGVLNNELPILLVLNKKDLIKPGEIAKKLEVWLLTDVYVGIYIALIPLESFPFPFNSLFP